MNSKQYLEQAQVLAKEIRSFLAELETLKEISTASGAINYQNDRVISSVPQTARFENTVVRLVDLEADIRKELWALLDKHREIRDVVSQIPDPDVRTVVRMKFLALQSVADIAADLHCSKPTVFSRMEDGYDAVAKITGLQAPPRTRMPARKRHTTSIKLMRDYYGQ